VLHCKKKAPPFAAGRRKFAAFFKTDLCGGIDPGESAAGRANPNAMARKPRPHATECRPTQSWKEALAQARHSS